MAHSATNTARLPNGVPQTHPAVATLARRSPLAILDRPTEAPGPGEALVHVEWTSSSPLELHQADGGLLVKYPFILGDCYAGTLVALGTPLTPDAKVSNDTNHHNNGLQVGDKVFGFAYRGLREKGFQTYVTISTYTISKLPPNITLQEAVTVSTNLITVFHAATADLGLQLPWPVPESGWEPAEASTPILVWGAASSVGMYAVQVLKHWGYRQVIAVASGKHHDHLKSMGAAACFDYQKPNVVERILEYVENRPPTVASGPKLPLILDCIASRDGTLKPLTKLAERGTKVAILLPVINVHATSDVEPEYEMDVSKVLPGEWAEGVELKGTRTHFYLDVSVPSEETLLLQSREGILLTWTARTNSSGIVSSQKSCLLC